jgi:hypothetical protein
MYTIHAKAKELHICVEEKKDEKRGVVALKRPTIRCERS